MSAMVVNLTDVSLFAEWRYTDGEEFKVRVPRGRYSISGSVNDVTEVNWRSALVGTPEILVDRDVTVAFDASKAEQAAALVQGRSTTMTMASAAWVRTNSQALWTDSVYSADPVHQSVFVQPTGGAQTGTFRAYGSYRLIEKPGNVWDLIVPMGDRVPADPSHVVTPAEEARMARIDERFAAFDGDTTKTIYEKRYGTSPEGVLLAGFDAGNELPTASTWTAHVSTGKGMYWAEEAFPQAIDDGGWVDQEPFRQLEPGSRVTKTWGRQPLRPGPYSGTDLALSACTPLPTTRSRGNLHVDLVDLQARIDGFDCGFPPGRDPIKRKLALYVGDRKIGEQAAARGDFTIPSEKTTYRLSYDNDSSALLPVSTRTSTTWTFSSTGPKGHDSVRVPLLLVDYDLGLDLHNQPTSEPAVFAVARMAGTEPAEVTGLRAWTSVDDGTTWQPATVKALGDGRFSAPMPATAKGQDVSLRVVATDAGGSAIDQQIIKAYRVR